MSDEQLQRTVTSWLMDSDIAPPDSLQSARQVAARLESMRQQSRWWPLPLLRRPSASPQASSDAGHRPGPTPATNGHSPTVIGRTHSMLSPAKAIVAGAVVFAVGSVMLVAQPFEQRSVTAPGAAADVPSQPPAEFTGTWCIGSAVAPDRAGAETTLEVGDEGTSLTRYQGGAWRNSVTMSDPRLQGDAYQTYESDTYSTGPSLVASTLSIVNADGAWVSTLYRETSGGADPGDTPNIFIGEGAYAGLVAVIEMTDTSSECSDIQGIVFDQPVVPVPYLPE
jgi:hypothetical protein